MTPKQMAFVKKKLEGLSNRAAVISAGYSLAGAKQMGTYLMRHPAIRAELERGGFDFRRARQFVARVFRKNAGRWNAVAKSMPRASYDNPEEFLMDAMNCQELPLEVRAEFAAALLPYQYRKLPRLRA